MVVTRLAYVLTQVSGFSAMATWLPTMPPCRSAPRGKTVSTGSVDSGQSMVRPTTAAS